ncbi:MAG: hypothetical protein CO093_04680 [Alphaproteobacteria bacterium CG_4_9_14_3_um_filter_47_13]|nr:MAG: hypothetical protein CO093_04680 [Alphaproteobacteria bacterium CG_4_9_14_3_um_filter_47_13]
MRLEKTGFYKDIGLKTGLFLCAALLAFSVSFSSFAAVPESPCDPQYMDALEARAWLEAQREITQNKNLIYKPDSVLEYTCFHMFLNEAASNFATNRQFSETDRWNGHPTGFSNTSTDESLTFVVLQPLINYLNNNFNTQGFNAGTYLNNRTATGPIGGAPPGTVQGNTPYNCAEMQAVWQLARCANFIDPAQANYDGFFDFARYETANNDPRREATPWGLMCTADPRFAANRANAFNNRQQMFDVNTEIVPHADGTPYEEDNVITHLDWILPGNCNLSQEIPTGISIRRPDLNSGAAYDERICTNPGCSAQPGGGCIP